MASRALPAYTGPMWIYPAATISALHVPAGHAERRYDRGLDIIRGDLVVDGKRREGKHRKNLST